MISWTVSAPTSLRGNACGVTPTISKIMLFSELRDLLTNLFPIGWRAVGGCDFAARPGLSAIDQPIFWSETVDTAVLRLVAGRFPPGQGAATLGDLCHDEVRISEDELHLLLRSIAPDLHLVADPGMTPDAPVGVHIPLDSDGLDRIAALDRLLRHLSGYKVPPDLRVTSQQRRRLKAMLRACDARRHNASQREIAEVIFGVERVSSEHWKTSPLRDFVRDLLKDGASMISGGYRKLLRFRRRS
jgi:hypothetical protein